MRAAFRYPPKGACKHIRTKRRVRKEYQYLYVAVNSPAGSGGKNFFFLFSFLKICFCCGVFSYTAPKKKLQGRIRRRKKSTMRGRKKEKLYRGRERKKRLVLLPAPLLLTFNGCCSGGAVLLVESLCNLWSKQCVQRNTNFRLPNVLGRSNWAWWAPLAGPKSSRRVDCFKVVKSSRFLIFFNLSSLLSSRLLPTGAPSCLAHPSSIQTIQENKGAPLFRLFFPNILFLFPAMN